MTIDIIKKIHKSVKYIGFVDKLNKNNDDKIIMTYLKNNKIKFNQKTFFLGGLDL